MQQVNEKSKNRIRTVIENWHWPIFSAAATINLFRIKARRLIKLDNWNAYLLFFPPSRISNMTHTHKHARSVSASQRNKKRFLFRTKINFVCYNFPGSGDDVSSYGALRSTHWHTFSRLMSPRRSKKRTEDEDFWFYVRARRITYPGVWSTQRKRNFVTSECKILFRGSWKWNS